MTHKTGRQSALHAIAFFEAVKGLAASAGLIGLLDLLHQDVRAVVMTLIGRFGLDPEAHYPSMLLHYAELLPDANIHMVVTLGLAYIALRFAEALGLWLGKAWGEYLGALSGAVYIPFELIHLFHEPSAFNWSVVLLNVLIVGYLTHVLRQRHLQRTPS